MLQPREITSLTNPRVKEVVRLHQGRHRRKNRLMMVQTRREITRALDAGLKLDALFSCPPLPNGDRQTAAALLELPSNQYSDTFCWHEVTEAIMRKLAPRENPEGVLAVFHWPAISPHKLPRQNDELWLVAVGLSKPGNLGAIVRSADAAGATGVIVCDAVVDVFHPSSIRSSTGAIFTLPVFSMTSDQARRFLLERNVTIYAASPDTTNAYDEADFSKSVAIVIGAEDTGLDDSWLSPPNDHGASEEKCHPIFIPMTSRTADSLNASVAAAVLLFEAARQRRVNLK